MIFPIHLAPARRHAMQLTMWKNMPGPENLLASFGRDVLIVFNSQKPGPVFDLAWWVLCF
tara:strand:- start:1770 stop:1949 length:180 start_codon:yes stop_codon:yes gene_type:complete